LDAKNPAELAGGTDQLRRPCPCRSCGHNGLIPGDCCAAKPSRPAHAITATNTPWTHSSNRVNATTDCTTQGERMRGAYSGVAGRPIRTGVAIAADRMTRCGRANC